MGRRKRINLDGYYYHIIARGQRKNPIFFSDQDFQKLLFYINKSIEKTDLEIYAYCLMRNHYHLLVKKNFDPLGKFMEILETNYALYFNNKHHLTGHVFQGRYKSFIVLNEQYLYTLIDYIHNNPIKIDIVERAEDYKFSSAKFYKTDIESPNFLKILYNYHQRKKRLIGIKQLINTKENYIGTKNEKIVFDQIKKNKKDNIYKDYIKVCKKNSINISLRKETRYFGITKNSIFLVINKLILLGYTKTEIAEFLNVHRNTINNLLKNK